MKPFSFTRYTKVWFALSLILILIGAGAMLKNKSETGRALTLGIDFTGGTLMELRLPSEEDQTQALADAVNTATPDYLRQITFTNQATYLLQGKDLSSEAYDTLKAALGTQFGTVEEIRFTTIGPKVGETLKQKAFTALVVALVAIVLYIAYAFRHVPKRVSPWRFGACAIVALAHDVFITLGVFALLGLEIDAFFITALLTIMGFSVHDTIVVFDRTRENLKKQSRDDSFSDVADRALNETLMRSINTSVSTMITLVALYIWGAESLRVFIFALMVGIIIGTYSSIFIASPLLALWQEKRAVRR